MTDLKGKRIKQYQIETLLGEGGMGAVYRALDTNLQRPVAIKVMHPHYARQPAFRHRFRQNEAQGVARLDHPSIIPVYDTGLENGILFIVMAFVPGANLASHIRHMQSQGKVVPLSETLFILAQVADALHYAHLQGVVHRDIKPDNILLKQLASPERAGEPPLRAVVTDFGLAHLEEGDDITKTGTFMGTLPYMSPEQCLGNPVDGGTDIYALGIILFQLSTGRLPFRFKSVGDAIQKHLHTPMPSPRALKPELPEEVEAVIRKATAKQRSDRYASAADLAAAFREAAAHLTPEAVTLHATVTGSHSLLTQLQSPSLYPEPSRLGLSMALSGSGDQLVVAKQGEPPRIVSLDKPTWTIGRTEDNDLPLPATGVSKRHALLTQTDAGWQVIDTKSTNGIYLKNQRLTAEVAHPWPAGQPLRLGPYILRWQRAGQVLGTRVGAGGTQASWMGSQMSLAPVGASSQFSRSGTLNVILNPTDVALPPGGKTDLAVTIQNLGFQVDHPSLTLDGLPEGWYQIPQNATQLMPEAEASLTVSLQPPADARAEAYPIRLRLHSQAQAGEVTTVSAQLTVTPQEQFSLSLSPSQLQHGEVTQATIHNLGNVATTYRLVGRDPANALTFANVGERLRLRSGEKKDVPIKVTARQQPWLGQVALRPFELVAASQNGQQQVQAGQLTVPPRIPTWLASAAGLLLLFLCGGGLLLAYAALAGNDAGGGDIVAEVSPTVELTIAASIASPAMSPLPPTQWPSETPNETPLATTTSTNTLAPVVPPTKDELSTIIPLTATLAASPSSTSTNTATYIPSPTFSPTPSATPTIKPLYQFDWFGENLGLGAFYRTGSATFSLSDQGLSMTGQVVSDRVWVDRSLPTNFRLMYSFITFDPDCRLYVGFGDGINWGPSYLLQMSNSFVGFHKYLEKETEFDHSFINVFGNYVKIGSSNTIVLERNNGGIRVFVNGNLIFPIDQSIDPEMTQLNNYNILFFFPNRKNSGTTGLGCSDMLLESFSVEEPG